MIGSTSFIQWCFAESLTSVVSMNIFVFQDCMTVQRMFEQNLDTWYWYCLFVSTHNWLTVGFKASFSQIIVDTTVYKQEIITDDIQIG